MRKEKEPTLGKRFGPPPLKGPASRGLKLKKKVK